MILERPLADEKPDGGARYAGLGRTFVREGISNAGKARIATPLGRAVDYRTPLEEREMSGQRDR